MSSILKALKKLEDEKTSHSPDSLKIDSDILKGSHDSRKMSPLSALLALLLMFGGGAAAAYFIMKKNTAPPVAATPPAVTAATANPPSPAISPVTKPVQPVAKTAPVPAQKKPSVAAVQKQQPKKVPATTAKRPVAKAPARTAAPLTNEKPLQADSRPNNELPAAASASVPTLRVNGIAFQNNSADSMAIINGTPVSSGSTIEGATVEEIARDRVVFRKSGEKFEVKLGQANR